MWQNIPNCLCSVNFSLFCQEIILLVGIDKQFVSFIFVIYYTPTVSFYCECTMWMWVDVGIEVGPKLTYLDKHRRVWMKSYLTQWCLCQETEETNFWLLDLGIELENSCKVKKTNKNDTRPTRPQRLFKKTDLKYPVKLDQVQFY